jgi:hypothetical protein
VGIANWDAKRRAVAVSCVVLALAFLAVRFLIPALSPGSGSPANAPAANFSIQPTLEPAGSMGGRLESTSCLSTGDCAAVGTYTNGQSSETAFAESRSGATWSLHEIPSPSEAIESHMLSVSCVTSAACAAVGYYRTAAGVKPLAAVWDGTEWSLQVAPAPAGAHNPRLEGVSCTAANACTAVGRYSNSLYQRKSLAERWNGVEWTIEATPAPAEAHGSELMSVSCISAADCVAVGTFSSGSPWRESTLAESWDGSSWSIQQTPDPSEATTYAVLDSVSCISASFCTAVGTSQSAEITNGEHLIKALAENWNGSSWSIQSTPNPNEVGANHLTGVSCTASDSCVAVGYLINVKWIPIVERWDGGSWFVESEVPLPATANGGQLLGVSCAASSPSCTLVGIARVGRNETEATLAESAF